MNGSAYLTKFCSASVASDNSGLLFAHSLEDFAKAALLLNQILDNEYINYSDKNKAEELLALANFSKDN